jgi:far upstream element-binding protein
VIFISTLLLGLLIGPRGATQKQLQESTGAKIIIRGRGAQKDGSQSNTGHPDDADDLHVSLEGPEEAVNKAYNEISQILFNPEQANKLKSEQQQMQMKLGMGGSMGGSAYGSGDSGDGSNTQIELRIPNNMVGLVIGKGGENILRIQLQLSVIVTIAKESEMQPGITPTIDLIPLLVLKVSSYFSA